MVHSDWSGSYNLHTKLRLILFKLHHHATNTFSTLFNTRRVYYVDTSATTTGGRCLTLLIETARSVIALVSRSSHLETGVFLYSRRWSRGMCCGWGISHLHPTDSAFLKLPAKHKQNIRDMTTCPNKHIHHQTHLNTYFPMNTETQMRKTENATPVRDP